jgi:hypothetical protein
MSNAIKETENHIEKYGRIWKSKDGQKITPIRIEMDAFLEGITPEEGGLGKAIHYRNVASAIYPTYDWHRWAQLRAQAFCNVSVEVDPVTGTKFIRNVTGLAGGTDSGKSYDMALFGLINWFCDPINTMVIAVSTSKMDARQRIWGALVKMYREAQNIGVAPGRLIESMDIIKLSDEEGKAIDPNVGISDASSIMLLAAGDEYKDDAQKRLQGKKNKRRSTKESDWQEYWGSSDRLKADVELLGAENFTREILYFCPSRGIASYLEAREQFERRVLETDNYYNGIINVRIGGSNILKEHLKTLTDKGT